MRTEAAQEPGAEVGFGLGQGFQGFREVGVGA